jgi:ATP-binding cassette subfamily C (CFTR/MRP) protein 1
MVADFERDWAAQRALPKPSLWSALAPGSGRVLFLTGLLHLLGVACQFASPLILRQIVGGLACVPSDTHACPTTRDLFAFAGYLAAASTVYNIAASHERIMLSIMGLRFRNKLMAAVYRKTLTLSSGALAEESAGRIVTLMSNDAQKLQDFFPSLHEVWAAPMLIGLSIWLLFAVLNWSTFIGLAVIFLMVPLTGFTAGKLFGLRRTLVGFADKRVNLISEVVNGIRVIKFYAWEHAFADRVNAIRKQEVDTIWAVSKISAIFGVLLFAAPVLIGVAAIGSYSLAGNALTAARVYTALSLFNLIRFPLVFLPFVVISFLNTLVALGRLTDFLLADEAEPLAAADMSEPGRITLSGCEFRYPQAKPPKEEDAKKKDGKEGKDGKKEGAKEGKEMKESGKKGAPAAVAAPAEGAAAASSSDASSEAATRADALADASAVDVEAPSPPFTLRGVTVDIPPGSLTMVIGPVGSGKSSLLAAINRYLIRDAGDVRISGSIAYVAQTAWILNETVENNILFGTPKDASRYAAALAAAQLGPDLAMLPFGDQTEIGERGVTLSGGQKQRVSIARAVYAAADINLLDDPLSAVDAHVGAALFEQCLRGAMGRSTRVLVTNALQYLPQADQIVVMEGGAVREVGTFASLREKGTDFDALCAAHEIHAEEEKPAAGGADVASATALGGAKGRASLDKEKALAAARVSMDKRRSLDAGGARRGASIDGGASKPAGAAGAGGAASGSAAAPASASPAPPADNANNLTGVESRSAGRVDLAMYLTYARAAGSVAVLGIILGAFSCEYGTKSFLDSWLGFWAADRFGWDLRGVGNYYLLVYACLFVANAIFTYTRSLIFYYFSMRASRTMHANMLAKVLRLPASFFDATPSGRIINRFSKDTETLDGTLPMVLVQMTGCIFNIVTTFVIISVASQWFIIALVPIFASYFALQRYYIPAYAELQRIESISRSPIYSDLAEAVAGVATIRAYRAGGHFTSACDAQIFANGAAWVTQRLAAEWLNVRLRFLGTAVSTLAAFLVISGGVPAGLAGLTLVYALDVTKYMEHGTAQASEAESKMNSVERMLEYNAEPEEASLLTPPVAAAALPQDWPAHGALTVEKLVLRYRPDLPPVLRGISFEVASGQKIGIVGRTGSGKSSLFLALFRMVEPLSGRVLLGGADTASLGLHPLRRAMAMIPQDPFMFGGSVRTNLDPFGEHADVALWEALRRVGLKELVEADSKKLEMEVVDNGANFSLGQRQLLCMSRALLRNVRVLMMDEATASVDLDTDALIQVRLRCRLRVVAAMQHFVHFADALPLLRVAAHGARVLRGLHRPHHCPPPQHVRTHARTHARIMRAFASSSHI